MNENITYIHQVIIYQTTDQNESNQDLNLRQLEEESKIDTDYKTLKDAVMNGFPKDRKRAAPIILPYWNILDELSVDKELVVYCQRIIISKTLRKDILKRIHSSHQGLEKTRRRARQVVYCPCLNNDIETTVSSCSKCQEYRPSQCREPMITKEFLQRYSVQHIMSTPSFAQSNGHAEAAVMSIKTLIKKTTENNRKRKIEHR